MTSDFVELGRRAVARKRWRWIPGTADTRGGRVVERLEYVGYPSGGNVKLDRPTLRYAGPSGGSSWHDAADFTKNGPSGMMALTPDLTDPATLGCLLALVREAWGDPLIHAEPEHADLWRVWTRLRPMRMVGKGATEAEALVVALEAAPAKAPAVVAFMDACLAGTAGPGDIDAYVARWHESQSAEPLWQFLGMTREEYARATENAAELAGIVEARKAAKAGDVAP